MNRIPRPSVLARFRPQLLNAMSDYSSERLIKDVLAGTTVAVVALPLAMAFATASGLRPEAGLFTAVIAGFLISLFGGSRVQIGGPAGAFIVIVYGILEAYGPANLVIATAMSGLMLFLMGLFKLGGLIRFIPIAVIIGFTNGIAVLIVLSQIKDLLGLQVSAMPADFFGMVSTLAQTLHSSKPQALLMALGTLDVIVFWQVLLPHLTVNAHLRRRLLLLPGSVLALVLATLITSQFALEIDTIGSRFGGIPSALPQWVWPAFSWESARHLLAPATTLALLGAIESLLCARVADTMLGGRHEPNQELMAQGLANIVVPFFGGMPATGTMARTVTNIKSGATSPVAGMTHALVLLLIMLLAAPLAHNVPLSALAAILLFVAWNMGEWRVMFELGQYRMPYRITLLAVFFLTVMVDLTTAVQVGLLVAGLTFIYRIASLSRTQQLSATDHPLLQGMETRIHAYQLFGAIFFGAVTLLEKIEENLPHETLVLDFKNVMYLDSSGCNALQDLMRRCSQKAVRLIVCGLDGQNLDIARRTGLLDQLGRVNIGGDLDHGLTLASAQSATR